MGSAQTARPWTSSAPSEGEPANRLSLVLRWSLRGPSVDFTHGCIVRLLERARGELGVADWLAAGRGLRSGVMGKGEAWVMESIRAATWSAVAGTHPQRCARWPAGAGKSTLFEG
jgi:hypothetical protein